jgi:hypothetical protein
LTEGNPWDGGGCGFVQLTALTTPERVVTTGPRAWPANQSGEVYEVYRMRRDASPARRRCQAAPQILCRVLGPALLLLLLAPDAQPARAAGVTEALQQRVEQLEHTVQQLERQVKSLQRTVQQLEQRGQKPETQGAESRSAAEVRKPVEAIAPSAAVLAPIPAANEEKSQAQRQAPALRAPSEIRQPLQAASPATAGLAPAPAAPGQKPEMQPPAVPRVAPSEPRQPVQTAPPSAEGRTLTPETKEHWRGLRQGMPDLEVQALLGEPSRTFQLSGNTVWYYYYIGTGGGSVMFSKSGKVTSWQHPPFGWLW